MAFPYMHTWSNFFSADAVEIVKEKIVMLEIESIHEIQVQTITPGLDSTMAQKCNWRGAIPQQIRKLKHFFMTRPKKGDIKLRTGVYHKKALCYFTSGMEKHIDLSASCTAGQSSVLGIEQK